MTTEPAADDRGTPPADELGIPPYARGYERFPGRIGRTTAESERAWPRERRAPDGAPNIVVVLMDDMGYSDIGPFGGEIPTPTLDRLAAEGFRLTNYHTTPVCSPARAALLTGLNPHRAGFASVANSDPGFPPLRLEIDQDVLTLPEILRANGYATFAVGKWHLTRDALMNDGAAKDTWPCQRGFDRYYGTLEGCNSFFHPNRLIMDDSPVTADEQPADYYLTDDLTDRAIGMIQALRANDSRKPFLLYMAHHAMHGPLGAKPEDIERHRGRYDGGWDRVRETRLERQIADGIVPEGTPLPDRADGRRGGVPAWDSLPVETQERYARFMEVYAAMVDNVDQSLGRVLDVLEALGELDDTIVIFTSDNGGTAEGGPEGTRSYFSRFQFQPGLPADWDPDVARDLDLLGGPRTMIHYPAGWGMVSNTPFRRFKGETYAGGIRVPFVVRWPRGLRRADGDDGLRPQYQYVTDILPTLLELAGVRAPAERQGSPAQPIDGASFAAVLRDGGTPSTHPEQYTEFGGSRGFYRDGWKIITDHRPGTPFDDAEWQLYHVAVDPTELHDVSAEHPEVLRELAAAWERAAWANTVFPLDDHILAPIRRPAERELERPVRLLPGTPRLERYRSSQLIDLRSFTVDIELEHVEGADGVLVAHGDQGGGYSVFVEDGRIRLAYNEYGVLHLADGGPLAAGTHLVRLEARWLPGFRWELVLSVDGWAATSLPSVHMLTGMAPFTGIDVGRDRGGPVHWELFERHGSFPYQGTLRSVTYVPGERADYDPSLVAEVQRDAALAYD